MVAVGIITALLPVSGAQARTQSARKDRVEVIDSATILREARSGATFTDAAFAATPHGRKLRARADAYLEEEARAGRFIDLSAVTVASVADPFQPGETIDLAWSGEAAPSIRMNEHPLQGDNSQLGASVVFQPVNPGRRTRKGPAADTSAASGYTGANNKQNMYKENNACATVWFNPKYASKGDQDHQMNTCWEIWGQDKTVHFIYNRWALWTLAKPSSNKIIAETTDASILSRPWRSKAGDLTKINKSTPSAGSKTCESIATITIGGSYSVPAGGPGVTGEVSVPIHQCTKTWVHFDNGSKQFGLDWDGETPDQIRLDAAGDYDAKDVKVLPTWADQTFVALYSCDVDTFCTITDAEQWKYQDTGW